ncbi:MAG: hypothetical protein K1X53_10060 [Candidatus Sumerlaeaceae bacterium]|nr:hypothetical protein [Candidatus Sumerlaeaceae bacterium]
MTILSFSSRAMAGDPAVTSATGAVIPPPGTTETLSLDELSTLTLADLVTTRALKAEREKFLGRMKREKIESVLPAGLTSATLDKWDDALWVIKLLYLRNEMTSQALAASLAAYPQMDEALQRVTLETAYAVYGREFTTDVLRIAEITTSPKHFAMCAHYANRALDNADCRTTLTDLMKLRFPDWSTTPILVMLEHDLRVDAATEIKSRPAMADLFAHKLPGDTPVIFSLQRRNREYPGMALVRLPDGKFVRRPDGSIFAVSHLAFSQSNLPGYITNGNTPEGLFTIVGLDRTKNLFIGKTPFFATEVPFEAPLDRYFHNATLKGQVWSLEWYLGAWPVSWRDYFPVREAFYAGQAGRSEMLSHGTTIDPAPYRAKPYYPNTPSIGCLTAKEIWSPEDGHALVSDQLSLIKAFISSGMTYGYLIVVDLDSSRRPVVLEDVLMDLLAAEGRPHETKDATK